MSVSLTISKWIPSGCGATVGVSTRIPVAVQTTRAVPGRAAGSGSLVVEPEPASSPAPQADRPRVATSARGRRSLMPS